MARYWAIMGVWALRSGAVAMAGCRVMRSERGVVAGLGTAFGLGLRSIRLVAALERAQLARSLAHFGLFSSAGELAVFVQDRHQLAVNAGRTSQHLALFQKVRFAGEVAHQA